MKYHKEEIRCKQIDIREGDSVMTTFDGSVEVYLSIVWPKGKKPIISSPLNRMVQTGINEVTFAPRHANIWNEEDK